MACVSINSAARFASERAVKEYFGNGFTRYAEEGTVRVVVSLSGDQTQFVFTLKDIRGHEIDTIGTNIRADPIVQQAMRGGGTISIPTQAILTNQVQQTGSK